MVLSTCLASLAGDRMVEVVFGPAAGFALPAAGYLALLTAEHSPLLDRAISVARGKGRETVYLAEGTVPVAAVL